MMMTMLAIKVAMLVAYTGGDVGENEGYHVTGVMLTISFNMEMPLLLLLTMMAMPTALILWWRRRYR
jgi:hypothetical protein